MPTHGRGGLPSPLPVLLVSHQASPREPEDTIRDSSHGALAVGSLLKARPTDAPCSGHRITVGSLSLQDSSNPGTSTSPWGLHRAGEQSNRVQPPGHRTPPMPPSRWCQEQQAAAPLDAAMTPCWCRARTHPHGAAAGAKRRQRPCQAWALIAFALGSLPASGSVRVGVQEVWVVPHTSQLSPTALSGTLGVVEGWRAEGAGEPQGGDITAGSTVPHPHLISRWPPAPPRPPTPAGSARPVRGH